MAIYLNIGMTKKWSNFMHPCTCPIFVAWLIELVHSLIEKIATPLGDDC